MPDSVNDKLRILIDHLLEVIDFDHQDRVSERHMRALNFEPVDRLPVIMSIPDPQELPFPPYPHREIFHDPAKMLYNELTYAFHTSIAARDIIGDDLPITIRANFGTVVIASLFGAHVEQVEDNPPWIRHGDEDISLQRILDVDPLDFSQGWCPRIVETCQFYHQFLADYPELQKLVTIVLSDMQGPFDSLELIAGSNVFIDLCTQQDLVSGALDALATAQIGFAKHIAPYVTEKHEGFAHQHVAMFKGNIQLRNDSVIMMSPEMYRDLISPHDERVLSELNGGSIHSCGKADMHVPAFLELPSIRSLDLGQSELNDVDSFFSLLQEKKIPLMRFKPTREELVTGSIMEKYPTGVSLLYEADSLRDAKDTMEAYLAAAERR